jgi:hypothetical protein
MEDWERPDEWDWEACPGGDHDFEQYPENWPGDRSCADCGVVEDWLEVEARKNGSPRSSGRHRMGKEN